MVEILTGEVIGLIIDDNIFMKNHEVFPLPSAVEKQAN